MKKHIPLAILIGVALLIIFLLVGSCASAANTKGAVKAYLDAEAAAMEDGVVTPMEQAELEHLARSAFQAVYDDAGAFDWEEWLAAVAAGASTAFFGVNIFRNQKQGKGFVTPKAKA